MNEERLTALEEHLSHMLAANDDLSHQLIHALSRIEGLERRVVALEGRVEQVEEGSEPSPAETRPPHW